MTGPLRSRLPSWAWTALNVLGLLVLVAAVLPFVTAAFPAAVGAEQTYVVTSGSMEPAIGVGDLVYVYSVAPGDIQANDVITYDVNDDGEGTTHRVIEVLETEEGLRFQTKGDANEEADPYRVAPDDVVGRTAFSLPYVGRAVVFANSRMGILTLLIVPAALLILNEVYTLGRAYLAAQRAEADDGGSETDSEPGGDSNPDSGTDAGPEGGASGSGGDD